MDGSNLISEGKTFHKAGATAEEAYFLKPNRNMSLVNGTPNVPSLQNLMEQDDVTGERWSFSNADWSSFK